MIILFAGNDGDNKIKAYERFLASLPKSMELFFVSRNNFNKMQIESLYSGAGLFSPSAAAIFSGALEHEETREFILEKLGAMGEAKNTFVFLEGKLTKAFQDAFKEVRAEMNIFELPKQKLEKYDNFLVANAFARGDKLNTWVHFRQAADLGVGLEEIVGVLFWKIKDMILRRDFSKFKEEKLKNSAARLSYLLPEARGDGRDAEAALENFILGAFDF